MDVPLLVDVVLAVLIVETVVLALIARGASRLPPFVALLPNLGAGLCLVLAVRLAVGGERGPALLILLAIAGACHVADLGARLRSGPGPAA